MKEAQKFAKGDEVRAAEDNSQRGFRWIVESVNEDGTLNVTLKGDKSLDHPNQRPDLFVKVEVGK